METEYEYRDPYRAKVKVTGAKGPQTATNEAKALVRADYPERTFVYGSRTVQYPGYFLVSMVFTKTQGLKW